MALYTVETPNPDNFSKNPVQFRIGTTGTPSDTKQLGYSIKIQDYNTLLWEEIYEGIQRFDSNGQSELDIARICDAQLEFYIAKPYDYSVTSSKYITWKKQARKFKVDFWESDDKVATTISSSEFFVVKGGVAKEQWDKAAVAAYYFDPANMRFLTYNQNAFRDQGVLFISFYVPTGGTFGGNLVRTTIGNSTGITNYGISAPSIQPGQVCVFFLDISTLTSDVYKLVFSLDDSGPVSEVLNLNVITRPFTYSRVYAYINSLGGTDVFCLPYNQIKQTEQARDNFSRLDNFAPVPYLMEVSAESFQANQTEELVTAIDAGELTAAMQDRMRDFTLSPARFELVWSNLVSGSLKYVPVNVITKKNTITNWKNRAPVPMYFEIVRALKNILYTPGNTDFNSSLTNDKWEGVSAPLEDYFYFLLDPLDNPAQFAFTPNAKVFIDYGDNSTDTVTGATTHTYADNKPRKITIASILNQGLSYLYITAHGKVSKIWGKLPELVTLKLNTQALTAIEGLPERLQTLEIESNALAALPVLPPNIVTANLQHNQIENCTTAELPVSLLNLDLSDNKLTVADVNYILTTLDTNGASNGYLNLASQTPSAAPTGAGITAKANLVGKGWAVGTD